MASAFNDLVSILTPVPVSIPEEYDGWQYRWKGLVFRPALLKTEGYLLGALLFYCFFAVWGSTTNSRKVKKWFGDHLPIYEQQFSKPQHKDGMVKDGYSDTFNFSTGRRNIASLHTVFTLRPRHDFLQWAFQTGRTFVDLQYRPRDDIQLDFKLSPGALNENFVFAIVAKDELLSVKDGRWDLTFTKTSENPTLPRTLSVMSEFADVTENIVKILGSSSLITVLQDPKIMAHFRSLSITDQTRDRPSKPIVSEEREKHIILSLNIPPPDAAVTIPLLNAIFSFIDSLNKISLRSETKIKLKKIREDLDKSIKEDAEKEKKEEALDAKAAAKRKAEEERISKLSPAEQKKELEKEQKRRIRKSQSKMVRK